MPQGPGETQGHRRDQRPLTAPYETALCEVRPRARGDGRDPASRGAGTAFPAHPNPSMTVDPAILPQASGRINEVKVKGCDVRGDPRTPKTKTTPASPLTVTAASPRACPTLTRPTAGLPGTPPAPHSQLAPSPSRTSNSHGEAEPAPSHSHTRKRSQTVTASLLMTFCCAEVCWPFGAVPWGYPKITLKAMQLRCDSSSFLTKGNTRVLCRTPLGHGRPRGLRRGGVFVKDFVDRHVMLVHGHLRAHLLPERQGHGVGPAVRVLHAALQVRVVVAPAPPQPAALSVKPETRQEDEIESPCGKQDTFTGRLTAPHADLRFGVGTVRKTPGRTACSRRR